MEFGSFKDFIESTGDEELMDLYLEGLKLKDMSKLEKRLKEKADDVPAMLSKNEFVFTADAVRGAGNGSIERGAQKMYDTMKRLEKRVV